MAYEHKPGSFSLFKNDKGGNEKRPDYTGDGAGLDGTPIKVSAWLRDGAKGKFMSCQIQEKTNGEPMKNNPEARKAPAVDPDVPF